MWILKSSAVIINERQIFPIKFKERPLQIQMFWSHVHSSGGLTPFPGTPGSGSASFCFNIHTLLYTYSIKLKVNGFQAKLDVTIKWHFWQLDRSRAQVAPDQTTLALKPPSPLGRLRSVVNHSATNDFCVAAEGEESFTLNITELSCCGDKLRSGTWPK